MRLYVGNLPFKASENDVHEFFAQYGVNPVEVNLMRDRMSGEPRGFGFVEVGSQDDLSTAIQVCNGKELMGRQLVINEARPREEGGGGGGGGNRGGGGGRERRGGGGGFGGNRRY
jgi:cold-inducible RNA-binding protein